MNNILGCLLAIVIFIAEFAFGIAIACLIASWLCDIEPTEHYTWYSGIWHGLFCIPNWIRSFFDSEVLCKANTYTTWYNIWWWIIFIWTLLGILFGGGSNARY